MNNVTVEAIELALMKKMDRQDDDMRLYDNEIMCASVTKNGMNLLTANEVQKELSDLRKELSEDLRKELSEDLQVKYLCYIALYISLGKAFDKR